MVDFDFSRNTDDDRVLLITFNNEKPLSAAQAASVLRALDSDYRDITGRELILGRMEMGSIWLWLIDAAVAAGTVIKAGAEVAKAASDLGSFAKKLKNGFESKAQTVPGQEPSVTDGSVDKSVLAMAKVSEETKSTIRIKKTLKTDIGVETLEIVISPVQAKEARRRLKNKPTPKAIAVSRPPALEHNDLTAIARSLPQATGDLETIIRAFVEAHMMHGSIYVLEQVATTFEHEGRFDVAMLIRQLLGKGKGHVHVEV